MTVGVDDESMPWKDPDARRAYHREYMKRWYRQNRELHMQRVLKVNRERSERGRQFLDKLKRQPCSDCGLQYPPYVMDFDHVRGEKLMNLSRLRTGRLAWARILAEVDKCEVVCANCHRIRTKLRLDGLEVPPSPVAKWLERGYVVVAVR
ncbi:MAG: hypothetical protein JO023_08575 [Chloroflexi bacterium]|nr:hypothetical protein [Chloroflexota bacterium]